VRSALAKVSHPVCVASNGPLTKLEQALRLTKLDRHFSGRIFSAYEVGIWKPDPGLFLHAANAMNAAPSRCVVVEDSSIGVQAGVAAGMRVLGYAAFDECLAAELEDMGAEVFNDVRELPALLNL
jgi:HAD superfamily hydrolase (TIGR01509 family)